MAPTNKNKKQKTKRVRAASDCNLKTPTPIRFQSVAPLAPPASGGADAQNGHSPRHGHHHLPLAAPAPAALLTRRPPARVAATGRIFLGQDLAVPLAAAAVAAGDAGCLGSSGRRHRGGGGGGGGGRRTGGRSRALLLLAGERGGLGLGGAGDVPVGALGGGTDAAGRRAPGVVVSGGAVLPVLLRAFDRATRARVAKNRTDELQNMSNGHVGRCKVHSPRGTFRVSRGGGFFPSVLFGSSRRKANQGGMGRDSSIPKNANPRSQRNQVNLPYANQFSYNIHTNMHAYENISQYCTRVGMRGLRERNLVM